MSNSKTFSNLVNLTKVTSSKIVNYVTAYFILNLRNSSIVSRNNQNTALIMSLWGIYIQKQSFYLNKFVNFFSIKCNSNRLWKHVYIKFAQACCCIFFLAKDGVYSYVSKNFLFETFIIHIQFFLTFNTLFFVCF